MTLEELLNKLIEKGRVPFGEERITKINRCEQYVGHWNWGCWSDKNSYWRWKCTRELVSKESGLWQFVCENGIVNKVDNDRRYFDELNDICYDKTFHDDECQYWIIESALCDEDKLEEFLLKNIKVE